MYADVINSTKPTKVLTDVSSRINAVVKRIEAETEQKLTWIKALSIIIFNILEAKNTFSRAVKKILNSYNEYLEKIKLGNSSCIFLVGLLKVLFADINYAYCSEIKLSKQKTTRVKKYRVYRTWNTLKSLHKPRPNCWRV